MKKKFLLLLSILILLICAGLGGYYLWFFNSPEALFAKAKKMYNAEEEKRAIFYYECAAKVVSDDTPKDVTVCIYLALGNYAFKENDNLKAERYWRKAFDCSFGSNKIQYGLPTLLLDKLHVVYLELGRRREAFDIIQHAIACYSGQNKINYDELTKCYEILGDAYKKEKNYSAAISAYEKALNCAAKVKRADCNNLIKVMFSLAELHRLNGNRSMSMEYAQMIDAKLIRLGTQTENVYPVFYYYQNLGGIWLELNLFPEAAACYRKADAYINTVSDSEVICKYSEIARKYENYKRYLEALDFQMRVFNLLKKTHPPLAKYPFGILLDIADILYSEGKPKEAEPYYADAVTHLKDNRDNGSTITIFLEYGDKLYRNKKYVQAIRLYQDLLLICNPAVIPPEDLVILYLNLGNAFCNSGKITEGKILFTKALSSAPIAGTRHLIAGAYINYALAELAAIEKDWRSAEKYYKVAIQYFVLLANPAEPDIPKSMFFLCDCYVGRLFAYMAAGEYPKAEKLLPEIQRLQDAKKNPPDFADVYRALAVISFKAGNPDKGMSYCNAGLTVCTAYPEHPLFAKRNSMLKWLQAKIYYGRKDFASAVKAGKVAHEFAEKDKNESLAFEIIHTLKAWEKSSAATLK